MVMSASARSWAAGASSYNRSAAPMEAERIHHLRPEVREALARGHEPIVLLGGDVVVYRYVVDTPLKGPTLAGIAFVGKAVKPAWRYLFRTEAQFDEQVLRTVASRRLRSKAVIERKAQAVPTERVAVGQVFVHSWGYDQTNIDFYEVLSVSPSGKTVRAAKVSKQTLGTSPAGGPSDRVVAIPTQYGGKVVGAPFKANVRRGYRGQSMITLGPGHGGDKATLWEGDPMHETGAGWGH